MKNDDDFLKELLSMFKVEAEEHLKTISSGLVDLEKTTGKDRIKILEVVYREAHSLKGAARAVNLIKVEQLCQSLESIFALLKRDELEATKEIFDVMLDAVDVVSEAVESPDSIDITEMRNKLESIEKSASENNKKNSTDKKNESKNDLNKEDEKKSAVIIEQGNNIVSEQKQKIEKKPEPDRKEEPAVKSVPRSEIKSIFSETVRIPTTRLDSILLQIEEMVSAKLVTGQVTDDLKTMLVEIDVWRKEWEKIYTDIKSGDTDSRRSRMFVEGESEFFNWNFHQIKDIDDKLIYIYKMAESNFRQIGSMIDNLLSDMKSLLMLPFSTLLKMVPKVVRDIARDQDKDVELIMRGSTTEVDRRILEEIKDPLVHLLRNCIDHGIEKPEERIKAGKPEQGTISISISQIEGNKIEIVVQDDGRGIDPEAVKRTAVQKRIISEQAARNLTRDKAIALIFESDLSTSPIITDISGRGLGLAIVREKVENLGGMIQLETEVGKGTMFRIVLPVTLATFRGTLVESGGRSYVIPTSHVERASRISVKKIKTVENRRVVTIDNQIISLVHLSDILGIRNDSGDSEVSDSVQFL
ncbi:hybrid sensor histidine kinase/response regulator, partial [candidate division KSB1 bacterium]